MTKNNKGITLIALVITIIVLLILAGVSIAMLTGSNGVITKARQSEVMNKRGEVAERINMAANAVLTDLFSEVATTTKAKDVAIPDAETIKQQNGLDNDENYSVTTTTGGLPESEGVVVVIGWTPEDAKYGDKIYATINYKKADDDIDKGKVPFAIKDTASAAIGTNQTFPEVATAGAGG